MFKFIRLILKIFQTVRSMFLTGQKIDDIKSMCFVEYANYVSHKKNYDKAIKYYRKALHLNSKNYYALCGLATKFIRKKMFKEALEICREANSLKSSVWGNITIYIIYECLGDSNSKKEALQPLLKYFKRIGAVYDQLSHAYFILEMYEESETYCKEAIRVEPSEVNLHFNLGKIYLAQKKIMESKHEFNYVLKETKDKRYQRWASRMLKKSFSN